MTTAQIDALNAIRNAGHNGIDAWKTVDGKRARSFSAGVIAALVLADLVEIAQDSRRGGCATYYRAK